MKKYKDFIIQKVENVLSQDLYIVETNVGTFRWSAEFVEDLPGILNEFNSKHKRELNKNEQWWNKNKNLEIKTV